MIRARIGFGAVAMTEQVERVGGVSVFGEFGSQIVPIVKRRGDAMDQNDRRAAPLLDVICSCGNFDVRRAFHISEPIHAATLCRYMISEIHP